MAENDTGEKTEKPTGRRLSQARTDGTVVRSIDLSHTLGLIAAFVALQSIAPRLWQDLMVVTRGGLSWAGREELNVETLRSNFYGLLLVFLPEIMVLFVIAAFFGAGSTAVQTKFLWSNKLLKPKFSNLNPLKGLRRLFSVYNLVNLIKSIAKLGIILPVAYFAFFEIFPQLLGLMDLPITQLLPFAGTASSLIFWRIISLLVVLAILDYIWQWWSVQKKLKMTKVEVKDERKSVEGDEQTKMTIRSRALQRARQRMMQAVKTADVVVTNPTHFAVALKYDLAAGKAPRVVAKGRGHMAQRIKEMARDARVPVIERKPLARALFAAVEVGHEIPYELYAAVADLLAYVYRLKGKNPFRGGNPAPGR